jgi:hypothetical protein
MRRRVLRAVGPEERRACNRARAEFRRRLLGGRSQAQVDVPFQIVWRFGHDVAPQLEKAADIFPRSYSLRQNDTGQAMQPDFECRDHAKVATATSQGPKQIGIVLGVGAHDGVVGGHEGETLDVVSGKSETSRQPSRAATQDQPGRSGVRNHT